VWGDPNFFLHISSSWAKIRLLAENQLPRLSESALQVCVGWWWWVPVLTLSQNKDLIRTNDAASLLLLWVKPSSSQQEFQ
jgi:hypothetical protein